MVVVVKGDAERQAEKEAILNRKDVQWALDQCNWWRNKNNCQRGCQCNWCKTAFTFESLLSGGGSPAHFWAEDRQRKEQND